MQRSTAGLDGILAILVAVVGGVVALRTFPAAVEVPPPVAVPNLSAPSIPDLPSFAQIWSHQQPGKPAAAQVIDLETMSPAQIRDQIGQRVYRVQTWTGDSWSSCAGFPIAQNQIATAYHCLSAQAVELQTADGSRSFPGVVAWADPANDAAILTVTESLDPFPTATAQVGEKVWAFGYPTVSRGRLTLTPSQVEATDAPGGDLVVPAIRLPGGTYYPGNSGGPLLNRRGEVVGIAHAILESPPHTAYAIPIAVLP